MGPSAQALRERVRGGDGALPRARRRRRARRGCARARRSRLAPSRSAETFGLAAAEAMAAGVPVAASRVGALPELLEPDGARAARRRRGALAAAIGRLAGDRAAGRARARAGAGALRAARPWPAALAVIYGGAARPSRARKLTAVTSRAQRPDHGHHGPGRVVPGRAAAREGLRRHRPVRPTPRGPRAGSARRLRASARARSSWCEGELLEPETLQAAIERSASERDLPPGGAARSCPPPGSARRRRSARSPAPRAAILEAVRDARPRHARVRAGVRGDLRRGAGEPAARGHAVPSRRRPTRSPSSPRTSSSARCAPRRPARQLGDRLQPRVRAQARAVRDPPDHAARAAAIALGLQQELTLGSLDAVRDWSFAGDIVRGRLADAPAGAARATTCSPAASPHTVRGVRADGLRLRRARGRALPARRPRARARRPSARRASGDPSKARRAARLGAAS